MIFINLSLTFFKFYRDSVLLDFWDVHHETVVKVFLNADKLILLHLRGPTFSFKCREVTLILFSFKLLKVIQLRPPQWDDNGKFIAILYTKKVFSNWRKNWPEIWLNSSVNLQYVVEMALFNMEWIIAHINSSKLFSSIVNKFL